MITEATNPFEILDNLDTSIDYMSMLEPYLDNIELQDPQVGFTFPVRNITSRSNRLYAILDGGHQIELNSTTEKRWLMDVFISDVELRNKKELLSYIDNNPEDVLERINDLEPNVEIIKNLDGVIIGSISQSYTRDLKKRFFNNLDSSSYDCKLYDMNKGGYLGYINGVQVFVPGSLASYSKIENYEDLLGKTIKVMIDGYVKERDIFIASNKKYIQKITPELIEQLDKTKEITGRITGITPFGIFVSFGEFFNGLLHVSEMSEETNSNFKKGEFSVGDDINFFIKSYTEKKIILSECSYEETVNKWESLEKKYLNKTITSKPFKKVNTGFLFEIEPKIIGLLYDLESKKYGKPIELDKEYQVKIVRMDFESGKIFLNYLG